MAKPTRVCAEVTANGGEHKAPRILEAFQKAIDMAPPPGPGFDIQTYALVKIEIQYGGFVRSTVTRVTIDVFDGSLPSSTQGRKRS